MSWKKTPDKLFHAVSVKQQICGNMKKYFGRGIKCIAGSATGSGCRRRI